MIRFTTIAILAGILGNGPAMAFWGWSDSDQYSEGRYDGDAEMQGDASGEGEAEFTFSFTGRAKGDADFRGDADSDTGWSGYSYDQPFGYGVPYYYGPYGAPYTPQQAPARPPQ